ncbi:hypothetical protein U14_02527 [Candidatus Moduliflexus flocculans]|uniref:Uncharacterized protein n=1 Tax=Candidatus Moduliflexus flocculans TaxID=1499966 RepID=A0A081BLL8_9BACT|nr:hypothetical protein U14_02527 [Candidatus Moduliflexus flocculans]
MVFKRIVCVKNDSSAFSSYTYKMDCIKEDVPSHIAPFLYNHDGRL